MIPDTDSSDRNLQVGKGGLPPLRFAAIRCQNRER
jgi:hypothetical protein